MNLIGKPGDPGNATTTVVTDSVKRVGQIFDETCRTIDAIRPDIELSIAKAGEAMIQSLENGGSLLACGNGGSAADALHFTAEVLGRFVDDRRPLSAVALNADVATLTAVSNDYGVAQIFARQVRGLGRPGDILFAITTSGNSENVLAAIHAAKANDLQTILLSGRDGGKAASLLDPSDLEVRVPVDSTARIQEIHGIIIHCLCDLIDRRYQGEI